MELKSVIANDVVLSSVSVVWIWSDVAMTTGAAASSSDADQALQQLSEQVARKTPPTTLGRQICAVF